MTGPPPDQFLSVSLRSSGIVARPPLPDQRNTGQPRTPTTAERRLLIPPGTEIMITGDLLMGREPENAPQVNAGTARPVRLADPNRMVSRAHALVSLAGELVSVEDLGSTNGTKIAQPGSDEWILLSPHEPTPLLPGGRIRIGGLDLSYELDVVVDDAVSDPPAQIPEPKAESRPGVATSGTDNEPKGIGDYVFVQTLGSDERGAYFLAAPPARLQIDAELVVVKIVGGQTSDDAFRRATRELRAFAAAQSPHLIKVYDAGQDQGRLFYSTQHVAGGSLAEPADPLDDSAIIRAVAQAAKGAHALHEVGIVHQGITPQNILVSDGSAYLADLGLAQLMSPESLATSIGHLEAIEFLDPAILTGTRASRASDIWALATTLNKSLTGVGVFGTLSPDPLMAIRAVLTHPARPGEGLPPDLVALIESCLDPDPTARPATALELARKLESFLAA